MQGSKVSKGARKRGQLASLLVEAYQNREALEERIAEGRRNRKEAGNKYGAVHIFWSDFVFRLSSSERVLILGEQFPSWLCKRSYAPLAPLVFSTVISPVSLCGSPERGYECPVYGLAVTSVSRPNFYSPCVDMHRTSPVPRPTQSSQ